MGRSRPSSKQSGLSGRSGRNRLFLLITLLLIGGFALYYQTHRGAFQHDKSLVIYIFSNSDPEYEDNLRFFVRWGMAEDDGHEYVIVIQYGDGLKEVDPLPKLPSNARYIRHRNSCYDWGTIGWLIQERHFDRRKYKYFIFINSSVRGPFLPSYTRGQITWQKLFLSKLNETVKLVGSTISCEGSPKDGNTQGEWRTNPHVQSYVLATDQVGLQIWLDDGNVFKCYDNMWDTIYHSELGSSLSILNKGYSIDSFMMRYQDIDWRDKKNWACNDRINPYGEHYYDGISLNPFEVMFVKVKERVVINKWSFAVQSKKYTEWIKAQDDGSIDILSNVWKSNPWPLKAERLTYFRARGPACFDYEFYRNRSEDLRGIRNLDELWGHFVLMGAFEGRAYRFTCDYPVP